MKKMILLLACISTLSSSQAPTYNTFTDQNMVALAIPGQNGQGSSPIRVQAILDVNPNLIERVTTPTKWLEIDVGQKYCQEYLKTALSTVKSAFICASSQGTATALNAFNDHKNKIKGLFLESQMASGNSAICHTVRECFGFSNLERIPGSRYWLPYVAKIFVPSYKPSGIQAIKSAQNIRTEDPIVIAHCTTDFQLSIDDARATYHILKKNNPNVYLIEIDKDTPQHLDITSSEHYTVVQNILKLHKILTGQPVIEDLSAYQPDPDLPLYKNAFDALIYQEKVHTRIGYMIKGTLAFVALSAILYKTGILESLQRWLERKK
jgi:hypothetical protein